MFTIENAQLVLKDKNGNVARIQNLGPDDFAKIRNAITDIEAFVDARLSEFTTIEDALVELSDNYEESTELTQDAVVELADEVYALKEEIKQLKAKLGE